MFNGTQLTMPVMPAYATNSNDNGGFGNDGWGWIWIILIFAIFGGWGNGFGGFGGNGGTNGAGFQGWATRADVNEGFALNNLQSGITAIQQGICDSTYALNNTITNGFHNQTIATLQGFNGVTAGQNAIQSQLASCCCDLGRSIERGFADTNYNLATQTCDLKTQLANSTRDIVDASNANTRAILDFMNSTKISELQTKLAQAEGQLSQANQTNNIISALKPCPVPSFTVPNPYVYCNPCNTCGC